MVVLDCIPIGSLLLMVSPSPEEDTISQARREDAILRRVQERSPSTRRVQIAYYGPPGPTQIACVMVDAYCADAPTHADAVWAAGQARLKDEVLRSQGVPVDREVIVVGTRVCLRGTSVGWLPLLVAGGIALGIFGLVAWGPSPAR